MDTRQLRYFIAVFEQRNLSQAAARCNVAQSALSHHVARLESQLGVALFHRKPRGMEPTAAGVRLHEHARQILRALAVAEQDLKSRSEDLAGEIALGMPHSVVEGLGLALMRHVVEKLPGVHLSITEALSVNCQESLGAMEVDLALFYNPGPDPRLTMEPLLEEDIYCVGLPGLIGDGEDAIPFARVRELPVLLLRHGRFARAHMDRAWLLGQLGDTGRIELNSVNALAKALVAGLGCTLVPRITFRELLTTGQLRARPIAEPSPTRTLYMGRLAERLPTRLLEATMDLVRRLAREEVDAGRWDARLVGAQT